MNKVINKNNLKKLMLVSILFIYILAISPIKLQNDIFFDIKVGEKYVKEGISITDNFSIHEDLEYISHHFCVSIITYLVNNYFGFNGIYVLEIILTCILAFLFYKANRLYLKNKNIAYAFIFVELFLMSPFISTRAQIYSYIIFLLEFIFIEKILREDKKKKLYIILLTILPLLIVNFHAGTLPIYFIILFVYLLNYININVRRLENEKEYIKNLKYLFIPIFCGLLLMFINPFGIDGVMYSFKTLGNTFINNNILEFQKTTIENNFIFYIYLLIILFSYFFSKGQVKIHQLLFLLGSSFMTLISVRHFSIFVIMSIVNLNIIEEIIIYINYWFYSNSCNVKNQKRVLNGILLFCLFIIIVNLFVYKNYEYMPEDEYPLKAIKYIKNNFQDDDRIFNSYEWGSLLMYNNIKPFIDSRCDLYTEEYNKGCQVANDFMNAIMCIEDYNVIFKKYGIDYLFIENNSNLYRNLLNNEKYEKVYCDDISSIFIIKDI